MARFTIRESAFDDPRLRVIAEYLRDYISDPNRLSLPRAARIVNLSPEHLSRLFHERSGVRFHDWQGAYRMKRARQILLDDRIQIGAVGLKVGYPNPSTFARAYKRYEGMTARQLLGLIRMHPELKPILRVAQWPALVLQISTLADNDSECVPLLFSLARRFQQFGNCDAKERDYIER